MPLRYLISAVTAGSCIVLAVGFVCTSGVHAAAPLLAGLAGQSTGGVNYYVSTAGNDSNNGSQASPWRTISHASTAVTPGSQTTTIHVASGTYSEVIESPKGGTAAARVVFISDVKWGARIVNPAGATKPFLWESYAPYVDIVGFDIGGTLCGGLGLEGSNQRAISNNVHNGGAVCSPANGAAGIDDANYQGQNNQVIGNFVHDVGKANAGCIHGVGIYHSHPGGIIANNLVVDNCTLGIQLWHAATQTVIINNTVVHNGSVGILIGAGDAPCTTTGCTGNDNTTVVNNITAFNGMRKSGMLGIEEQGLTGVNNVYTNNLTFQDVGGDFKSSNNLPCSHCISGRDPMFKNNTGTSSGDYHLLSGSPAIGAGVRIPPTPPVDFDGKPRNGAITIGCYQ